MNTLNKSKLAAILAKAKEDRKENEKAILNNSNKEENNASSNKEISSDIIRNNYSIKLNRNSTKLINPNRDNNSTSKLAIIKAKLATRKKEVLDKIPTEVTELISIPDEKESSKHHIDMNGKLITYNAKQQEFVSLAASGASCVLIGAAGTGKTTCMQGALEALIKTGKVPPLEPDEHKHLIEGTPGCVIIAYTRRATNNIRKILPADLKANAITSHKLLEYAPEFFEVMTESGNFKKTMRFVASRNETNPLPNTIATIVVEESSMLSVELYTEIMTALDHKVQWIFLGDINQLPPVFGSAVLGFRLLDLPVVELTEVYRQALESPIIRLAHRILSGVTIPVEEFPKWNEKNKLTLHAWKKKIAPEDAVRTLAEFFKKTYDNNIYNIDEDIILMPYNKSCGTLELNKHIANHIARKHQRTTYEIVAGFNKHYLSIGDKVLYDKEDAEITEINLNAAYTGAKFQAKSANLDYWGHNPKAAEEYATNNDTSQEVTDDDIDFLLNAVASTDDEDRVRKASHIITVTLTDTNQTISIDTAADVNNLLHSYALTVHKAQGSEWRKVYLCLHQSHATMLQRELLYTAVTRAKEELYVICEPDSFIRGIKKQRIKGNTLVEKAEFFKGKLANKELQAMAGK